MTDLWHSSKYVKNMQSGHIRAYTYSNDKHSSKLMIEICDMLENTARGWRNLPSR